MEYKEIYHILDGKYTDKDIHFVRVWSAYELLKMIREDYGHVGEYEKLQKVLDVAGIKYNKCRKTGLPIAYVKRKEKVKTSARIDNDGINYISEDVLETKYYCPCCGEELPLVNDREARLFLRGYLSFDDIEKGLDWKYPISVDYKGHYKVDEDRLYYVIANEGDKIYKETLDVVKRLKSDKIEKISYFTIEAEIIDNEYADIVGNGVIDYETPIGIVKNEAISIMVAKYSDGKVIYG
jgi:hypothetical protein